jgi:hypothetical protein
MTLKEQLALQEERQAAYDKQVKAIRDLIHEGRRLGVETRKEMRRILAIQKRTDEKLEP